MNTNHIKYIEELENKNDELNFKVNDLEMEVHNLNIRLRERDTKIERQASVITKLEQSRKDLKARAADWFSVADGLPALIDYDESTAISEQVEVVLTNPLRKFMNTLKVKRINAVYMKFTSLDIGYFYSLDGDRLFDVTHWRHLPPLPEVEK